MKFCYCFKISSCFHMLLYFPSFINEDIKTGLVWILARFSTNGGPHTICTNISNVTNEVNRLWDIVYFIFLLWQIHLHKVWDSQVWVWKYWISFSARMVSHFMVPWRQPALASGPFYSWLSPAKWESLNTCWWTSCLHDQMLFIYSENKSFWPLSMRTDLGISPCRLE